ncbi:hypothetical protein [Paraburkholderia ribeironis]|uniref:hypothetical protein n=1 Tax=Paraburkholderia ribeironis TaxID=1247936 RepID=UPI0011786E35|nr:hypothetical protein [Paraburkholderia ribeironis]
MLEKLLRRFVVRGSRMIVATTRQQSALKALHVSDYNFAARITLDPRSRFVLSDATVSRERVPF